MSDIHPLLAQAFAELEAAGIAWTLLRGANELTHPVGDVDVLVARADRAEAERALERAGFRRLHAWGHGSHRFFLGYDDEAGEWLKVDVVTELAFGPYQSLPTRAAGEVLARARAEDGIRTLAPGDAFWALLLHCLADRGVIPPRHAAALLETAPEAGPDTALARAAPLDARAVLEAARSRDWERLAYLGKDLTGRWARRRPLAFTVRLAKGRLLRRLTPVFTVFRARGPTVALLGPDGAGKSTVADALGEAFPHHQVRRLYVGLYSPATVFSGPSLLRVPARLAWLAAMRARILRHRLRGRIVLLDRHTYDALLLRPEGRLARLRVVALAHGIARPDLLVLLDAPGDVMAARKPQHSAKELEEQRRSYLRLAERIGDVMVADATEPVAAVVRGIVSRLTPCLD